MIIGLKRGSGPDMQKKLLYITSRVFWPTKGGHEMHILNYCRALYEKYSYIVDVYIFEEDKAVYKAANDKPGFIRNVICGNRITKQDIVRNILRQTILGGEHWPIQSSLYFNKSNCKLLDGINAREHYDVLFVDMIRLAPYINAFSDVPQLTVLDMGDLLSKRYLRQIDSIGVNSNVGGAYTGKMPGPLQALLRLKWLQAAVLRAENRLMANAEVLWANRYDSVVLVSNVETDELNKKIREQKAVTVRVGIDTDHYKSGQVKDKSTGLVSFVGDMYTAANIDTVSYIISNILPLCNKIKRITFIGRYNDSLRDMYKDNKRVTFTGMVPDLRDEVKKTNVFLAPMAYGTGVKIKIIEAMAMGMPVVTNPIGAEGIPGENGVHWLVGSSDREIAGYVDELLSDPKRCEEIGHNAQKLIDETFSWDAATKAFAKAGL